MFVFLDCLMIDMTKGIEENAGFCIIESEECQTALIYGDVRNQSKSSKEKEKLSFGKYSHQDRNKLFQTYSQN